MPGQFDVVVIGAGIAGLAQAWAAAHAGHRVVVLEQSSAAQGASVRNFGMVWPIGAAGGDLHAAALRSRALWIDAADASGFAHHTEGAVFLATREDELAVLHEFCASAAERGDDCELLDSDQLHKLSPAANRSHVIGGMHSRAEVGIDPREAIPKLSRMLTDRLGVQIEYKTAVTHLDDGAAVSGDGRRWEAGEAVVVCSGAQTRQFFPEVYQSLGVQKCKLQMLATGPQPGAWSMGPMVTGCATLGHSQAFAHCPGLPALKRRVAQESPELDTHGIHILAAQNGRGEVLLGDSHQDGQDVSPFDDEQINELILRELRRVIDLPDWSIRRRWHGVYLRAPGLTHFVAQPRDGAFVFGVMGLGMTLAFGLAERMWATGRPAADAPAATK